MREIGEAVRAYLEGASGVKTVCAPARAPGVYPIQTVEVSEEGTVLGAGGTQAAHTYRVTVTAAHDRTRSDGKALLGALVPALLRGIPAVLPCPGGTERRVLAPQAIEADGDTLRFRLTLWRCVPRPAGAGAAENMGALHFAASGKG